METLGLNRTDLPASRFPERADDYFCDRCQRVLTKRLPRHRGHRAISIGPARLTCKCGEKYLSGKCEWDHLTPSEQRGRLRLTGLLAIFSLPLILSGVAIDLGINLQKSYIVIIGLIGTIPSALMATPFLLSMIELAQICASIWRTRIARPANAQGSRE